MFTIDKNVTNEIVINKSKFITYIYKVSNDNDVFNILDNLKREYKDATHYCYAYIIGNVKRFNDDGEPKMTAGIPILSVLEGGNLNNVLAVVIRYFGGTKLGTGGLIRAYSSSVSEALNIVNIIPLKKEYKCKIRFKYEDINKVNYILKDYKITSKEFNQDVIYEFIYEENNYPDKLDSYLIKWFI